MGQNQGNLDLAQESYRACAPGNNRDPVWHPGYYKQKQKIKDAEEAAEVAKAQAKAQRAASEVERRTNEQIIAAGKKPAPLNDLIDDWNRGK